MNSICIIGNLTKDVELYESKNGDCVATISVAVNGKNEHTDFFTVKCFGNTAENASKYLSKGKKVAVAGAMTSREYEDKQGNSRIAWEIVANNIEYLSPAEDKKPTARKR